VSKKEVDSLIDGGNASAGPPLGPSLGMLGVNAGQVIAAINEKTKDFEGMKVPVKIIVDEGTKEFDIKVGSPPTSALIKKELGIEKGTGDASTVGNMTFQQLIKISKNKQDSLLANDLKAAVKEVVGVCQTMGITVEGRKSKELTQEISEGLWDDVISGKTEALPDRVHEEEFKVDEDLKLVVEEEEAPAKEEVSEEGEKPEGEEVTDESKAKEEEKK